MAQKRQVLIDKQDVARIITRMAHEVFEKSADPGLALIGIRSRGVHLARRLARKIQEFANTTPSVGAIDVARYRDDRIQDEVSSKISPLEIPVAVDEKTVVLVDDVIFRGRTIRAAMQAINQLGQPKRIVLAVL